MKAKFVDHLAETATITKTSIKTSNGFESKKVIALRTNFGNKDETKGWATSRGGGWHPVEKFWWVPATRNNLRSLKQLSFFKGEFYCPNENLRDKIASEFNDSDPAIEEGIVFDEFSVFPEQEADYNSGYTELRGQEIPQMQGWITIQGKTIRTLILDEEPPSTEADREILQSEPRQYPRQDGSIVWCLPWVDPTDRWSMPSWPDADVEGDIEAIKEPQQTVILEVKAIIKNNDCVGARGIVGEGISPYQFDRALSWCKSLPGRKWNPAAKAWDIPLSAEMAAAIQLSKGVDYQGGVIRFSDRLLEEIESVT